MGRPQKYDWDTILNGETWKLHYGEDFQQEPNDFRRIVIQAARKRGHKVTTSVSGRYITVQAYQEAS